MKLNVGFPFFVRSSPIKDRGVTSWILGTIKLCNNLTRVATSRKLAGCPRPVEIYNIATTTISSTTTTYIYRSVNDPFLSDQRRTVSFISGS
jgi:hypothetical protein